MKLITWNCRVGGFRWKAKHVAPHRPDVLVVQEVENLDKYAPIDRAVAPTYRNRLEDPEYPRRGIGVFSYSGVQLAPCDNDDPSYCFRRFTARRGGLEFQVAGVWTAPTVPRARSYRQAHEGIERHLEWITARPTVILGDFNDNASLGRGVSKGKSWRELRSLTDRAGLVSAYHHVRREDFGAEKEPTHFHHGKPGAVFHLGYCIVPTAWADKIKSVTVGSFDDWHAVSDHAPLIVEIDV